MSIKPLKLTAESVGATIRGGGERFPGWVAHGIDELVKGSCKCLCSLRDLRHVLA